MGNKVRIPPEARSKQLKSYHKKRNRARDALKIQEKKADAYLWLRNNLKYKRYQAKKANIPFDLDEDWLKKQALMCAITGQGFIVGGPKTPSFDQRLPGKGYTKENTQLVCLWVNQAKGQWPEDQIRALIVEAAESFR